ncbi:MAG: iron-regulated protein, partial [Bacteroidetes bacterium]
KKVSYKKMLKTIAKSDIILFGESHNNAIAHWLQYEVTSDINNTNKLMLGAEMFEADNQKALSDYLKGNIDAKGLDSLARLWKNYKTDYKPLVDIAKKNKLQFIATNIPRRYASMVHKSGFKVLDTLTLKEKEWMAPLPMPFDSELATYKNILKLMGDHGTPELVMAQATKDATMAHFILKNYRKDYTFLHYNGSYHSDNYEGILWYLKRERPNINYATITTISQENVNKLLDEHKNKADFIICVDDNMTNTY